MGCIVKDKNSGKSYRIGASGRLFFTITNPDVFYRRLVGMGRGQNPSEQIKDMIRSMISNDFPRFLMRTDVSPAEIEQLPFDDILKLNRQFCAQLQQQITEFGIRVSPQSETGLIAHMLSKELGA